MAYNTFDYYKFMGLMQALDRGAQEAIYNERAQEMHTAYYIGIKDTVDLLLHALGKDRNRRLRTSEIMLVLVLAQCSNETMDEVVEQGYEVELADRNLLPVIESYTTDRDFNWVLDMLKAGGDYGGRYLSYDDEVDMFFTYYLP